MLRKSRTQLVERVDGERGAGQHKFKITGLKARLLLKGQLEQLQAVRLIQQISLFLKRVLRGKHKPNFIQSGIFCQVVGQRQMPDMYRIKGTKKQSDGCAHVPGNLNVCCRVTQWARMTYVIWFLSVTKLCTTFSVSMQAFSSWSLTTTT